MPDFEPEGRLYIDGEFREAAAGGRFDVRSPSDESVVGTAADAQAEDVAAAVGAARRTADETSWSTDHSFRQRVLRQLQDALRKHAGPARQLQIAEAGTPVSNIGAVPARQRQRRLVPGLGRIRVHVRRMPASHRRRKPRPHVDHLPRRSGR